VHPGAGALAAHGGARGHPGRQARSVGQRWRLCQSERYLCHRYLRSTYADTGGDRYQAVVISYSELLTRSHENDFRILVNDPVYRAAFPAMRIERESDREIVTTRRGKRIATSIEGSLTGLGGNLFVVDDPLKVGDAMSESVRARVIEWYRSTLLSRADDKTKARIVLVMQRVHQNDRIRPV
jgi:hypothetical protein